MSAPLYISGDDLREQENFNYSAIDQFWQEKGYTDDNLRIQYKLLIFFGFLNFFVAIGLYFSTWLWRKKIGLAKLLGEEKMNGWEKFCTEFKLGQTPAINFVSSCLVTNDRVFITLRIILALWSLLITIFTWAGSRSVFFGTYYPLATIITIYVNRHRHLIVEGFGSRMMFLNKVLQWLFGLQAPFRIVMAITYWTKWFGLCRYRDMMKNVDNPRNILFQSEFCPLLFLLTEMLWFDTSFDVKSCTHSLALISFQCISFITGAQRKDGVTAEPQVIISVKESPASSVPKMWMIVYLYPFCGLFMALIYRTKMWIFSKTPVIKERLEIRTKCIAIFKKRQILNKFLPKEQVKGRKTSMRGAYSSIGRKSMNRQTTMRKTQIRSN